MLKRNKYNAVKCTHDGYPYDSRAEAGYAAELDIRVKAKEISGWRRQVVIPLHVCGREVCKYRIDFEITHLDGSTELVEVKGFPTPLWRLKWKMFEAEYDALHPEIKRRLVRV